MKQFLRPGWAWSTWTDKNVNCHLQKKKNAIQWIIQSTERGTYFLTIMIEQVPWKSFLKCHLGHAIPGGLPNNIWTCHQGLWWLCPASFLSLSPGSVCTLWCCPAGPPRSQDTLPPHLPCPTSVLSCCGAHGPWSTPTFPEGLSWFSTTHWLRALLSSDPYFICF